MEHAHEDCEPCHECGALIPEGAGEPVIESFQAAPWEPWESEVVGFLCPTCAARESLALASRVAPPEEAEVEEADIPF